MKLTFEKILFSKNKEASKLLIIEQEQKDIRRKKRKEINAFKIFKTLKLFLKLLMHFSLWMVGSATHMPSDTKRIKMRYSLILFQDQRAMRRWRM